jgi:glycosyltransferase involved in cell wall biosynthesis
MPDYRLTVCGPLTGGVDKDFQRVYRKELYETANIRSVGWVDITSPSFIEIAKRCIGIVFPSCSESGGGGVITCMHAGLIPLVSYETSVDVNETMGVMLKACTVEEIKASVQNVARLPREQLESMAKKNWEFARANHSRERFAVAYAAVISEILAAETDKVHGVVGTESDTSLRVNAKTCVTGSTEIV